MWIRVTGKYPRHLETETDPRRRTLLYRSGSCSYLRGFQDANKRKFLFFCFCLSFFRNLHFFKNIPFMNLKVYVQPQNPERIRRPPSRLVRVTKLLRLISSHFAFRHKKIYLKEWRIRYQGPNFVTLTNHKRGSSPCKTQKGPPGWSEFSLYILCHGISKIHWIFNKERIRIQKHSNYRTTRWSDLLVGVYNTSLAIRKKLGRDKTGWQPLKHWITRNLEEKKKHQEQWNRNP